MKIQAFVGKIQQEDEMDYEQKRVSGAGIKLFCCLLVLSYGALFRKNRTIHSVHFGLSLQPCEI